eukprot:8465959-Alexandrium_andersonii.AAC.1
MADVEMPLLPPSVSVASPPLAPPSGPSASPGGALDAEPEVHRQGLDGSVASTPSGQDDGRSEGRQSVAE